MVIENHMKPHLIVIWRITGLRNKAVMESFWLSSECSTIFEISSFSPFVVWELYFLFSQDFWSWKIIFQLTITFMNQGLKFLKWIKSFNFFLVQKELWGHESDISEFIYLSFLFLFGFFRIKHYQAHLKLSGIQG